jgi:hypothetical protein
MTLPTRFFANVVRLSVLFSKRQPLKITNNGSPRDLNEFKNNEQYQNLVPKRLVFVT